MELAAIVMDCPEPLELAAFYQRAWGGQILKLSTDSAWLRVRDATVIFRHVVDYQPPSWPSPETPPGVHLDYSVDDLHEAETLLEAQGATTPDYQPHREEGQIVMLDPAGHPFCISQRPSELP